MSEFAALFPKIYFLRSHLVDKESYHLVESRSISQKPPVLSSPSQKHESELEFLIMVLMKARAYYFSRQNVSVQIHADDGTLNASVAFISDLFSSQTLPLRH